MAIYDLTQSIPAASALRTGDKLNCPYSGSAIQITLPKGTYELECWGAQGGDSTRKAEGLGGRGGYAKGTINLNTETVLYLLSGGKGSATTEKTVQQGGGFNGGGHGTSTSTTYTSTGGGGASDIRIGQNSLYARVIVAGGGGGGYAYSTKNTENYAEGGYGGGTSGSDGVNKGSNTTSFLPGKGGTQLAPGDSYYGTASADSSRSEYAGFGYGANAQINASYSIGGGGGWYGGGSARRAGGGGGSGYVYNSSSSANYPSGCLLNSDYYLSNTSLLGVGGLWNSPDGATESGHSGNGYVRITCTSIITSVTITYDWGGSLTYSQTIVPGTDKLIQKITDLPSQSLWLDFRSKLLENELVSGINFDKISLYRDGLNLTGDYYYVNNSTSNITSDLILYPIFDFEVQYGIRCIRDLSETTHTSWGSGTSVSYYLDSDKNFQLQNNSFDKTISVYHSSAGLSSFTYNNKTFNTYGWAEDDSWYAIYQNGEKIIVNVKSGYPNYIRKNYAEVYTDSTPINLIINNNSTDETQITKLRDQTLLMVLETSLSTQSNPTTILPKNPFSKKGYKFRGWSLNKDDLPGSSTVLAPGTSVSLSESTTYYAIWELKPQSSLRMWYGIDGKWAPMS